MTVEQVLNEVALIETDKTCDMKRVIGGSIDLPASTAYFEVAFTTWTYSQFERTTAAWFTFAGAKQNLEKRHELLTILERSNMLFLNDIT